MATQPLLQASPLVRDFLPYNRIKLAFKNLYHVHQQATPQTPRRDSWKSFKSWFFKHTSSPGTSRHMLLAPWRPHNPQVTKPYRPAAIVKCTLSKLIIRFDPLSWEWNTKPWFLLHQDGWEDLSSPFHRQRSAWDKLWGLIANHHSATTTNTQCYLSSRQV